MTGRVYARAWLRSRRRLPPSRRVSRGSFELVKAAPDGSCPHVVEDIAWEAHLAA